MLFSDSKPSPGSKEARKQGCTCPVLDNNNGEGIQIFEDGDRQFWITQGCPVHDRRRDNG